MGWVLVTGATGFIGRRVCQQLAASGVPLVVVGRSPSRLDALLAELPADRASRIMAEAVDFQQRDQVAGLLRRCARVDQIVHLASPVPGACADSTEMLYAGTAITLRVLELLEHLAVRHVTLLSSASVYRAQTDTPMDEDAPWAEDASPYALGKQWAERAVAWLAQRRGMGLAVLRPSQVYGPEEPHCKSVTRMIAAALDAGTIVLNNGGEDQRDLVYVDDVARGVVNAVVGAKSGVWNLAAGRGYRIAEMAEHIAAAAPGPVTIRRLPFSRKATCYVYATDRAQRDLGFHPAVTLPQGIRQTVDWMLRARRAAA